MTRLIALILACSLLGNCSAASNDVRNACTEKTVGSDLGSEIVTLTLLIPERRMTGAEISNGGISAWGAKCDFPLNAFFSDETVDHLIQTAADYPLKYRGIDRVAEAEMLIWKFEDGSGESRFFVTSIMSIKPVRSMPAWLKASSQL